jgi:hypothetical protein
MMQTRKKALGPGLQTVWCALRGDHLYILRDRDVRCFCCRFSVALLHAVSTWLLTTAQDLVPIEVVSLDGVVAQHGAEPTSLALRRPPAQPTAAEGAASETTVFIVRPRLSLIVPLSSLLLICYLVA